MESIYVLIWINCLLISNLICDFSLYLQCSDSKEWKADVLCLKEV